VKPIWLIHTVLSHNALTEWPLSLNSMDQLTKLSLSHNNLSQFPCLGEKPHLKELRLAHNAIKSITHDQVFELKAVEILDLGNNHLVDIKSTENLALMPKLHNLNLKGNPICSIDGYVDKVH
jgi:Leucine-rich repeat (LRR) protein